MKFRFGLREKITLLTITLTVIFVVISGIIFVLVERKVSKKYAVKQFSKGLKIVQLISSEYLLYQQEKTNLLASRSAIIDSLEIINGFHYSIQDKIDENKEKLSLEHIFKEDLLDTNIDQLELYDSKGRLIVVTHRDNGVINSHICSDNGEKHNKNADLPVVALTPEQIPFTGSTIYRICPHNYIMLAYNKPIYSENTDRQKLIGYIRSVKHLDNKFIDEVKAHSGLNFYYIINDKLPGSENINQKDKPIFNSIPILFPFTDVRMRNLYSSGNNLSVRQKWEISDDYTIIFVLTLNTNREAYVEQGLHITWFFIVLLAIMIILPSIYFLLNKYIVNPTTKLVDSIKLVKAGKYSRVDLKYHSDEFITIVNAFNEMIEAVERRENELNELNKTLEERVKMETANRIKQEQILFEQKKFADMGQMINAIAHQWRQPLNSLGLNIQMMNEDCQDDLLTKKSSQEYCDTTMDIVTHMSKTIDDFMKFFNESKELKVVEPLKLIGEVLQLCNAQLKNNKIDYEIKCKCSDGEYECVNMMPSCPCVNAKTSIKVHAGELKQAVMNLIQNAKDAVRDKIDKTPNYAGKIIISLFVNKKTIDIKVEDNGTGISENIINSIFDPYFTTKEQGKGTGIGLYMTKTVIEKHMNGKIKAENSANTGGALFTMTFPRNMKEDDDDSSA